MPVHSTGLLECGEVPIIFVERCERKGKWFISPMVDAWSVKPCRGWVYLASWAMWVLFRDVVQAI